MLKSIAAFLLVLISQSALAITPDEALAWGAAHCRSDIIADALSHAADITVKNSIGDMPLHQALRAECKLADIQMLIDNAAPVNLPTAGGATPLHLAITYFSDTAIVSALLAAGADVNAADDKKMTPIFYSIGAQSDSFSLLIKAPGLNLNQVSNEGTLLQYIYKTKFHGRGYSHFYLRILLEKGATVTNDILYFLIADLDKAGPYQVTVSDVALIQRVMAANPLQDYQDVMGQSALHRYSKWIEHLASADGNGLHIQDVQDLLIGKLGGLNQQDADGNTPLHILIQMAGSTHATSQYPSDWTRLFVASHADLGLRNKAGEAPIDIAKKFGLVDIEYILQMAGSP